MGTIYSVSARDASCSLILVTVLGFTPSGRTLGAAHYIEARCMAVRTVSTGSGGSEKAD
ncbi:MAG: hypothetical protein HQ569_04750 [Actinobacteria bacterium]|nr:hypothetical protein [Actinomycetota bacterium]